ncbi:MAG: CvpA family protein [Lachnospiraceae bacterium]|nr:CvpA family protein [Lachnospiraceae bacterium]
MNIYVVIVAVILLGCTILGAKKGFVHTVFAMFSLFLIILITGVLSPYVADYINEHTEIPGKIYNSLEQKIDLKSKITNEISISDYVGKIDMPEQLRELIVEKCNKAGDAASATSADARKQMIDNIYTRMTELIVSAIAYFFTFMVVTVIVLIAGLLLDIASKLPGIKQANTLLGIIMGFVQGYLIVSVLYIGAIAFPTTSLGAAVIEMVNESELLTWFYSYNPVVNMIFGMVK